MALWNGGKALESLISGTRYVAAPSLKKLKLTIAFTAVVFTLLQISPTFVRFYLGFLGDLNIFPWMKSFRYTPDLSDLITLPTLFVTYFYGRHRINRFPLEVSS